MKEKVLLLLILCSTLSVNGQDKHALIVAIGKYGPATEWGEISSGNDVDLIKAALTQQGFDEENIRVIQDEQATKEGIKKELKALANRVKTTDVVVFHYSGHGQQVLDDNEDEFDGYDEALVPYDAHKKYKKGVYEGENHLRDEELGSLLNSIRQNSGDKGEVLVVLDACHSGTGTRGDLGKARGSSEPLAPDNSNPPITCTEQCSFDIVEEKPELAPMICFFGASPNELNYETYDDNGNGVGSLSYSFSKALTSCATPPTYESLFDRIKVEMAAVAPRQTPQIEGNTNLQMFSGKVVTVPLHYKINTWHDDSNITIEGGNLHGLFTDSEISLFPMDTETITGKTPVGKGKIIHSDFTTAIVALEKPVTGKSREAWAFLTAKNHGQIEIKVRLDLNDPVLKKELRSSISERQFIKIVEKGEVDVVLEKGNKFTRGENLQLTTNSDHIIYNKSVVEAEKTASEIIEVLNSIAQAKYLRPLASKSDQIAISLEMVPITVTGFGQFVKVDKQLDIKTKDDGNGNIVFKEGEYFQLKVTNHGRKGAYFTILDFMPDNNIAVMLPGKNDNPVDFFLAKGESKILPQIFSLSPPYGTELFKLISSETPIDLRGVVINRGPADTRGNKNPFEVLFEQSYRNEEGTRGTATVNIPPDVVNVNDFVFIISKK